MNVPILCILALAAPLHAGEIVPSQVPASAKWLAHADLDAMRDSETGKTVFSRIEDDHGDQLKAFKRMFSVHPLTDLRGITLYGDGKPDHAVALIDGAFDQAHIEDIVKVADHYEGGTHAGFTVHTWKDKGKKQHAAFASGSLLVFSHQRDLLEQALDVLKADKPADADPFFTADGGKPLLAASAKISEIDLPGDEARIIRMAKMLRLAATENGGRFSLRAGVETGNPTDADRIRRVLDGMIAFAQMADLKLDGLDLQADLAVTPDKPGLTASLSLPVAEWIALMERAAAEDAKKKKKD